MQDLHHQQYFGAIRVLEGHFRFRILEYLALEFKVFGLGCGVVGPGLGFRV